MSRARDPVLVAYVRTPFGRADPKRGWFRNVRSDDLAALVLEEIVRRAGIGKRDVDGIFLGAVEMLGEQAHPASAIPYILADFPPTIGMSVERACTTAMMSVHVAAMSVQTGMGDIYLAGGLDSMTRFRIPVVRDGMDMSEVIGESGTLLQAMNPNPKMFAKLNPIELNGGQGAEKLAARLGISREEMDRWALESHRRAVAARDRLRQEILPVEGVTADGERALFDYDQGPRADTTYDKIAALPPVYSPEGRITAATSSGQADGAAVCLVMSRERAKATGLEALATIRTLGWGVCEPTDLIYSAIPAARRALERAALRLDDMGVIEVNEAFACAPIALMKEFGFEDATRVNPNGGACALGHPVGASGARLVGTTALEMRRRGARFGLATICGGMGQGAATILELDD
ncbi:MAG: thiolase family protein [Candidatus Binatia bacterium]